MQIFSLQTSLHENRIRNTFPWISKDLLNKMKETFDDSHCCFVVVIAIIITIIDDTNMMVLLNKSL